MSPSIPTREFIYLDTERVRSIFAQIEGGIVEEVSHEKGSDQQVKGTISGGLPGILKGQTEGTAIWIRRETETRTLHDHMFNIVEARLKESENFIDFLELYTAENWDRSAFADKASPTAFVKVRGHSRINDFKSMAVFMGGLQELGRALASISTSQEPKHKRAQAVEKFMRDLDLPDKKIMTEMQSLLERFYGDSVVLKVWPFEHAEDCGFVCRLDRSNLRDSIENLVFKFGYVPQDPWVIVGQIAKIAGRSEESRPMRTHSQDDFEHAVELMFDGCAEVFNMATASFPYISLTPLAVYRE